MNKFLILVLALIISIDAIAQLEVVPVPRQAPLNIEQNNARIVSTQVELDTMQLPFWDDFSFSGPGVDTTLWQNGLGVFVNPSIGINQPTINVATFDGINVFGRPYNLDSDFVAPTDSLVSHAIDLSDIAIDKQSSLYFSFFWQMQGLGELPDEKDSIRVEFLDRDGVWNSMWSAVGLEENLSDEFQQVYIQVNENIYFHSGFRFKFQSFGNTNGAFDSWHIDYVYLNQDRTDVAESIFDHAISTEPLSLFNTYTTIPYSQLFAFPDTIFSTVVVELLSFEGDIQPVEYNYVIRDELADQTIFVENSTINPLAPFGIGTIETASINNNIFNPNTDSLYISTEFQFISGDNYLIRSINNGGADTTFLVDEFYNYRLNDTTRKEIIIHDILAYDDGSAEFAAGIRGINGQLAIEFVIAERDTITAVDINFPIIKPTIAEGDQMRLWVYDRLSGETSDALAAQDFAIIPSDTLNEFNRYTFERPVVVSDTFYIAFQQFREEIIAIGLDKTNNQGDKIWINTADDWEPNLEVEGSLMIRPIFGKTKFNPNAILGVEDEQEPLVRIYPNPSTAHVNIEGLFDRLEVYSISGQLMHLPISNYQIDFSNVRNGIYLLKVNYKNRIDTHKVVIRH